MANRDLIVGVMLDGEGDLSRAPVFVVDRL